jgi:hypothetical protein
MADAKGYDVASVDVARAGSSRPSAYVTFFDSTPKATDAQTKLKVRSYGGVPPQQRGSVVVGYLSVADMNAVDPAIQGCL